MDKKVTMLLRIAVSAGLLYYIISKITIKAAADALSNANLLAIPLIIALFLASFLVKAMNYKLLTKPIADVSARSLFKVSMLSWAAGMFAPGKLGEFSAIYFLKKEGVSLGAGTAISVLDKLITVSVLAVISAIALLIYVDRQQAAWITVVLAAMLAAAVIAVANSKLRLLVRKFVLRKYENRFTGFSKYLFGYVKKNKLYLLYNYGLAVMWIYVSTLMMWVALLSVGIKAPMLTVFLINSASVIVSIIPATIGGLGARETTAVLLFGKAGFAGAQVLGGYLLVTVISNILAVIVTVAAVMKTKKA